MRATTPRASALWRAVTLSIALIAPACTGAEPRRAPPDPASPAAPPSPASAGAPTPVAQPEAPPAAPAAPAETLPPVTLDCTSDADCILSDIVLVHGECCYSCPVHVVNTRWKQQADEFCKAHPGFSCPKYRCAPGPPPNCRAGQCTNEP